MLFLAKQFHRAHHLGFSPCVIRMIGITVDVTLWEQAPLVIGADGIRSVVRSKLFGSIPLRDNGRTMWRALIDEDLCSDLVPPISPLQNICCHKYSPEFESKCRIFWVDTKWTIPMFLSMFLHFRVPVLWEVESTIACLFCISHCLISQQDGVLMVSDHSGKHHLKLNVNILVRISTER
jgi:hypothetical protein